MKKKQNNYISNKTIFKLQDLPEINLPRERLLKYGAKSLSDYELLAIILRTGSQNYNVLDLARDIIISFHGINYLNGITIEELITHKGVKKAKAIEILASIEFGKRVCLSQNIQKNITNGQDLYEYVRYDMENLDHEETKCAYLNVKGGLIDIKTLSVGSVNTTQTDFREVVKWALKLSSSNIIIIHNHPSGDSTPSYSDKVFTNELIRYGSSLGINLLDHLIIGKNSFYSFQTKKSFNT